MKIMIIIKIFIRIINTVKRSINIGNILILIIKEIMAILILDQMGITTIFIFQTEIIISILTVIIILLLYNNIKKNS